MKRLQVLTFGNELAAGSRRPLVLWMTGFLVFAWLPSAMAQQEENRPLALEPIAAPGGEPVPDSPHWVAPDLPRNPKRLAVAGPQEDDPQLSDPEPPRNSQRRIATALQADDAQLSDPEPPRNPRRPPVARRYEADVEPPADGPYAEEDDGACEECPPYPNRCCEPACCWQPLANRLEARGEWLLWWGKGNSVPALVTSGPSTQTQTQAGILGAPGTVVLFGDSDLNDAARSGARLTVDCWLTCDHSLGLEAQCFGLGDNTASFQANSNNFPVLARPFFNTQTGAADSGLIGYPGVQTGNVSVSATTVFQGAEALLRQTWFRACDAHLDFLAGYRYLRLSDDLSIDEFETFINPQGPAPVNSTLALSDRFSTLNEFQGADLGLASDWHYERWNLGFLLKVGLGNTSSRVTISGSTVFTQPTLAAATSSGGFLAQASNSGQYQRNQFTMVPELGINLGFDLTPRLRLVGGYSLIYWSAVARTGDQIDLNLAPPQFPPPLTPPANHFPEFRFATTDYWAQGLNVGLDLRF